MRFASNSQSGSYDPEKGDLEQHIFAQLHFELLNCKRPYRLHGMTGMPAESCGNVISLPLEMAQADDELRPLDLG